MKILKPKKRKPRPTRDLKKEAVFKELSAILSSAGFTVRREKLRQGHGWKAASGSCCALGDNYVFVDSRLSQEDQLSFLIGRIRDLEIQVQEGQVGELPRSYRKLLLRPSGSEASQLS